MSPIEAELLAGDEIRVFVPGAPKSTANLREHWTQRHKRNKNMQAKVRLKLNVKVREIRPVVLVVLQRKGKVWLDSDNLVSSMKDVRDAVAKTLRIDDGSPLVDWRCTQQLCGPDEEDGTTITIRRLTSRTVGFE